MNISFEGKVALVTCAASGLGFATAKACAESIDLGGWRLRNALEGDADGRSRERLNSGLRVKRDHTDKQGLLARALYEQYRNVILLQFWVY